jgi:hypothetical protein
MKNLIFVTIIPLLALKAQAQNVGIGTTTPLSKLHVVNGASGATPVAFSPLVVESNTHTYINLLSPAANETAILFGQPGSSANGVLLYNNFNTPHGFQFRNNGGLTRMVIDNTGNVGIGTINPQKNLSVQNGMNIDQADGNTGSVFNTISFGNNSGEGIGSNRNAGSNQWGLDFYTGAVNRMSISNGGDVGIGTTNPSAKLHVSAGDASIALFGPNSYGGQLAIGATPNNQTTVSTAQVIASDGNLHIDPAAGKNIYVGYFQARDIYLDPNGGHVGIGTNAPAATLEVNGYSKLGSNAPSIKVIKVTGTTAATEGGIAFFPLGLTASKIISVSVIVQVTPTFWVAPHDSPGSNFKWSYNSTNFSIVNFSGDSANILSKPFVVFITYEE